jgi:hypothetical protein
MAIDKFERFFLDNFCGMQTSPRWVSSARTALPLLAGEDERIRSTLTRHKAFTFFDDALRRLAKYADLPAALDLAERFKDQLDGSRAHYLLLSTELAWLQSVGLSAANGAAAIKGFSNARFYSDPQVRWSRDIDLFLPTWEQTGQIVELLRSRGYEFDPTECPWIKAEPRLGRSKYGQVFMVRPIGDGYSRIDLHFSTHSVSHGEYLRVPLTDFYEFSVHGTVAQLDATGTLLVMFGHALSDGYMSIKDANDCVAMATAPAPVDWNIIRREIRRHSFAPQASVLSRYLKRQYADDEAVMEFAARLSEAGGLQSTPLWRMHDRSWVRRAAVNAGYTFRAAHRQRRGLRSAVVRAMQCFAFTFAVSTLVCAVARCGSACCSSSCPSRICHAGVCDPMPARHSCT